MTIKVTYNVTDVYMSQSVSPVYINVSYSDGSSSGGGVWGTITGTLSNQTDLQNALNAKLDESTIDGGTEGQILSKASATDFDFAWINNYAKYLATNVRNQTGSTIAAFQVVYISGATGNKPLVSLADADTEATSSKTYGVTATAIANNGTGDVVTAGELTGINTSAFNEGDLLWLSTTAGAVVTTPPAEPAHAVFIGYVVRSHPTLGTIDVSIQNGYELNELHGVQITSAANNDGLFYNSTSTLWENKSIATALGYTPANAATTLTINGVTYDLSTSRTWTISTGISGSGASGQVTYWTGASAVSGSSLFTWDNTSRILQLSGADITQIINQTNTTLASAIGFRENGSTKGYIQYVGSAFSIANRQQLLEIQGNAGLAFRTGAEAARFFSNGNLAINSTSDLGVRLGVVGDTLLRGSGNTSATTALTVQNSASTNLLTVRNDGPVFIHAVNSVATLYMSANGDSSFQKSTSGTNGIQLYGPTSAHHTLSISSFSSDNYSNGALSSLRFNGNYVSSAGSTAFSYMLINGTINQTGTSTSITRGLYVNPTLTAAADFRAIETTAGNVLFGSNFFWDNANGRLGIGTNVPTNNLEITRATGTTTLAVTSSGSGLDGRAVLSVYRIASGLNTGWQFLKNESDNFVFRSIVSTATVTERMTMYISTGNIGINTTSDLGQRLQVIGDTLLRGSGATSATTALTVQNSGSTNTFRVRNDGGLVIGNSSLAQIFPTTDGTTINTGAQTIAIVGGTGGYPSIFLGRATAVTNTFAGTQELVRIIGNFTPASGSHNFEQLRLQSTINQTGGANGITRGLYVNPTLTSAADFRAIETARGNIVFSNLPTSSAGLPSGALWNNGGVINIV